MGALWNLGYFILACIAGIGSLVALISPYSAYGRIASNLFAPIYQEGNNLLAYFAERMDSYAFYSVDVWVRSLATMGIAILSFVILAILAWRNGRTYCNTICPVGTVLGFLSKYALLKPRIDTDKCNGCGLCARKCKASCIDSKNHAVDYSRCVTCMDCLDNCRQGAISYTRARKADKVTYGKRILNEGHYGCFPPSSLVGYGIGSHVFRFTCPARKNWRIMWR